MGTDIHGPWVEVYRGEQWWPLACFEFDRSYELFAKMAGVRSDEGHPGMFKPKGLPHDATYTTREELADCHSVSWLAIEECQQIEASGPVQIGFRAMLAVMRTCAEDGMLCRAVFGFDS